MKRMQSSYEFQIKWQNFIIIYNLLYFGPFLIPADEESESSSNVDLAHSFIRSYLMPLMYYLVFCSTKSSVLENNESN